VHDQYWSVCGFTLCVWKFFGGLSIYTATLRKHKLTVS
jgi:hypothetical protein